MTNPTYLVTCVLPTLTNQQSADSRPLRRVTSRRCTTRRSKFIVPNYGKTESNCLKDLRIRCGTSGKLPLLLMSHPPIVPAMSLVSNPMTKRVTKKTKKKHVTSRHITFPQGERTKTSWVVVSGNLVACADVRPQAHLDYPP